MVRLRSGTLSWVSLTTVRFVSDRADDWIVVGDVESQAGAVNLRNRDDEVQGREEIVRLGRGGAKTLEAEREQSGNQQTRLRLHFES